jgi:hypothetical protein
MFLLPFILIVAPRRDSNQPSAIAEEPKRKLDMR